LNKYFVEVVKFRFVLLGFYVAGSLTFLSNAKSAWNYLLVVALSVALFLAELRNRVLYTLLAQRGMWIERQWGHEHGLGYFGRQFRQRAQNKELDAKPFPLENIYIMITPFPRIRVTSWLNLAFSHSVGIDLCFYTIIAISIYLFYTFK